MTDGQTDRVQHLMRRPREGSVVTVHSVSIPVW